MTGVQTCVFRSRQMHGQDYAAIRAALNDLNGVEAPPDDEEEENPMTPSAN